MSINTYIHESNNCALMCKTKISETFLLFSVSLNVREHMLVIQCCEKIFATLPGFNCFGYLTHLNESDHEINNIS